MAFRIVFIVVFVQTAAIVTGLESDHACQQFTADKEIKNVIESKRKLIEPCPCVKQKIDLDYSFEKIGDCYRQWHFVDGVKQMCCYSPDGNIQTGAPQGGFMLFEALWKNISAVHRSCCLEEAMCDLFYKINPSDDCSTYKPPTAVTSYGDPTIQTIDGNTYDFNGNGEYVFLNTRIKRIFIESTEPGSNNTFETEEGFSNGDLEMQVRLGYVTPGNNDATLFEAFSIFIAFTAGDLMNVDINVNIHSKVFNISGLAGHQMNGAFVFRNGTEVDANSSASILFDYGESWSLVNESDSHFDYSLTDGNFTFYNGHHTRPTFLEDLVGNLTALFEGYPGANISLFNETCRNYWDNTPNEQCLLTIARSKNYDLGLAVMATVNETQYRWEINHNTAPGFLDGMPDNITAIYKEDHNITINVEAYVSDNGPKEKLTYYVNTSLSKYTFEKGIFTWTVSTELRYNDTRLTFCVVDQFDSRVVKQVIIHYCGCNDPRECDFDTPNEYSSANVMKAGCQCPGYFTGMYCETELDPCKDYVCFDKCSVTFSRSTPSWPCSPCPKGREELKSSNEQTCSNIDECAPGYSGVDKCEHICTDTDGSFVCSCRSGYMLNADKHSCDDIDECRLGVTCLNGTCINFRGSWNCLCPPGIEIHHINESFIECQGRDMFSLEDAVTVKCTTSRWDISINMDILKTIYPGVTARDIYLGQPHCHGNLENPTLKFRFSINDCKTTEIISGITNVYNNKLFYAVFDPVIPFLIRQHVWTFAVECDDVRGGAGTSHLHHGIDNHHETFINHYDVNVELFADQNFLRPISGDSQTVHVGEDVYVKVSSLISDWNTKMRLHTCFTRPNRNATTDLEVLLISNGCEVDANTHIISQSTHETKFVFQDFEYVTNDEGLDVNCNATFCDSKDYSPGCVQSCVRNPALVG